MKALSGDQPLPSASGGLNDWLRWLEAQKGFRVELGLDRVNTVWHRLNPSSANIAPTVFTIAGTNGKGSTCHSLEALALAHGYRVGLYTSPHLIHFNERCRINGEMVADHSLVAAFSRVAQMADGVELTYFEFTTLAILWLFMTLRLDVVILEVGMGGRLDAVNCIDANVAVITSIHFDHAAFLGNDLASIAAEKAGIARTHKPLVIAETEFSASVLTDLEAKGVPVWLNGRDFYVGTDGYGQPTWTMVKPLSRATTHEAFSELSLPHGSVMPVNMSAALQAWLLSGLRCDRGNVQRSLASVKVTGRQQWCRRRAFAFLPCDVLVDVAHNQQSVQALAHLVVSVRARYRNIYSVVGLLSDKLDCQLIAPMKRLMDDWSIVPTTGERGVSTQQMIDFLSGCGVAIADSGAQHGTNWDDYFLSRRVECSERDLIVVWGSFHVAGPFLEWLQAQHQRTSSP